MSNYPPGVTGREFEIAGYDDEQDVYRDCGAAATILVLTRGGRDALDQINSRLTGISRGDDRIMAADASAIIYSLIKRQIIHVDVDVCPFEGEVTIGWYGTKGTWQCPLCQKEHIEYAPEPDDEWFKD